MDERERLFRERLLAADPVEDARRERYEKEVRMMLEHPLTGARRWAFAGSMVLGAGLGLLFAVLAVIAPAELPLLARLGFVLGALFGLGWAVLVGRILVKGAYRIKVHGAAMAGMVWVFVVGMMTLFLLLADKMPPARANQMLIGGLVFLIFGAAQLVLQRIEMAELKVREKMLEMEYRLAEIAEGLKKK